MTSGSLPSSIIVVDANNDTKADLVVTNTDANTIIIYLGFNNGTFATPGTSYTAGSWPCSISSGDFNHDGRIDLAVVSRGSNQLLIFLGYGNGTFHSNYISYTTGTTPYVVRTGDFNNDGKSDLVVGNFYGNTIGIYMGTGSGTFIPSSPATYSTGINNPIDIVTQDLNDDGIADLSVSNQGGNFSVQYGYGNGSFAAAKNYWSKGTTLKGIVAGDFDEDGQYDIAILNNNLGNVAVMLGQCN